MLFRVDKRPSIEKVMNQVRPTDKVLARGYRKYSELLEKVLRDEDVKQPIKKRRNSI